MLPELYTDMARLEASHFWFRGRRTVLEACLNRHLPRREHVLALDAGCGVGTNFAFLESIGAVVGVELYHEACLHCDKARPGRVVEGRLESLPFRDNSFSVVALLDVLEHIDDQKSVLAEIKRVVQPGGAVLITVPAFSHLWSGHDVVHQHKRRYLLSDLRTEVFSVGLKIEYISYFNTHLYPLVLCARLLRRASQCQTSDMQAPPRWMNTLLYWIFRSESIWLGRLSMPFGVSLVAVVKKS